MDPREVFSEVPVEQQIKRNSPSYDLARLRWCQKHDIHPEGWKKIVNLRWRNRYIFLYDREKRGM